MVFKDCFKAINSLKLTLFYYSLFMHTLMERGPRRRPRWKFSYTRLLPRIPEQNPVTGCRTDLHPSKFIRSKDNFSDNGHWECPFFRKSCHHSPRRELSVSFKSESQTGDFDFGGRLLSNHRDTGYHIRKDTCTQIIY